MGRKSFKSRSGLRLLARDQGVPDREEGLVVVVDRLLAERRDLVRVPVALEVFPILPDRGLAEVEWILDVPGQGPPFCAEGHRPRRGGLPDLVPALRPEGVDVPVDVDDIEGAAAGSLLLPGPLGGFLSAHLPTSRVQPALTRPPRPGSPPGPPRSCPPPRCPPRRGSRSCRGACSRGGADAPPRLRRSPSPARAPAGSCPPPSAGWLACTRRRWRSASRGSASGASIDTGRRSRACSPRSRRRSRPCRRA